MGSREAAGERCRGCGEWGMESSVDERGHGFYQALHTSLATASILCSDPGPSYTLDLKPCCPGTRYCPSLGFFLLAELGVLGRGVCFDTARLALVWPFDVLPVSTSCWYAACVCTPAPPAGDPTSSSNLNPNQVNASGVMPIIFASSLVALPSTIARFLDNESLTNLAQAIAPGGQVSTPHPCHAIPLAPLRAPNGHSWLRIMKSSAKRDRAGALSIHTPFQELGCTAPKPW